MGVCVTEDRRIWDLLPGREPHHLEDLGLVIFKDEEVSMEVAEHLARHDRAKGCTCAEIVFGHGFMEEGDRIYRILNVIHQAECPLLAPRGPTRYP
jgi:hypothetical protein